MARILLADDEEALRLLMGRQLRRGGHDVALAEDGLVALELLQSESYDVVISDMKMPRLDGMGLLARARDLAPAVEFIVLTGHGSMENAVEAFKNGNVFDYLLKPLEDIRELDAVVERAVERRHLRAENARLVVGLEERVQELEEARRQLADLADRDSLTGLLNHRAIHARLDEALDAEREAPLAVVLLDVDGFKLFNDTLGHLVGDQVLRRITEALRTVFPAHALLGRCGGDEFMVVLPGATSYEAGLLVKAMQQQLSEQPFRGPEGTLLPISLCGGIADVASAGRAPISLIAAADAALYQGKQRGGETVILHLISRDEGEDSPIRTAYDVLDSLVTAIDNKDRYTKRHSLDVTEHALRLTRALNLSEETCDAVRLAGLLHDVGKIGIPDAVLRKPGKLTDQEYAMMQQHVTISTLIIHGLPRLSNVLEAVANHHERWDGTGYPNGLKGEEIPLLGRIMAIADAFSAMTVDRPYRAAFSVEQALAEIERGAGTQFDPELARLFVASAGGDCRLTEPRERAA